jgi:hypothetical protein
VKDGEALAGDYVVYPAPTVIDAVCSGGQSARLWSPIRRLARCRVWDWGYVAPDMKSLLRTLMAFDKLAKA